MASTIIKKSTNLVFHSRHEKHIVCFGKLWDYSNRVANRSSLCQTFLAQELQCLGYDISTTNSERSESLYDNTVRSLAKSEHARSLGTRTPELEYKQ